MEVKARANPLPVSTPTGRIRGVSGSMRLYAGNHIKHQVSDRWRDLASERAVPCELLLVCRVRSRD